MRFLPGMGTRQRSPQIRQRCPFAENAPCRLGWSETVASCRVAGLEGLALEPMLNTDSPPRGWRLVVCACCRCKGTRRTYKTVHSEYTFTLCWYTSEWKDANAEYSLVAFIQSMNITLLRHCCSRVRSITHV